MPCLKRVSSGLVPEHRVEEASSLDLSFPRFDKDAELTVLPADLAVLMVDVAARQSAGPTAAGWAKIGRLPSEETLFAPVHGAFNGPVATALLKWKDE